MDGATRPRRGPNQGDRRVCQLTLSDKRKRTTVTAEGEFRAREVGFA
jgi:hypothetical protein